jgi:hypothetical protein
MQNVLQVLLMPCLLAVRPAVMPDGLSSNTMSIIIIIIIIPLGLGRGKIHMNGEDLQRMRQL